MHRLNKKQFYVEARGGKVKYTQTLFFISGAALKSTISGDLYGGAVERAAFIVGTENAFTPTPSPSFFSCNRGGGACFLSLVIIFSLSFSFPSLFCFEYLRCFAPHSTLQLQVALEDVEVLDEGLKQYMDGDGHRRSPQAAPLTWRRVSDAYLRPLVRVFIYRPFYPPPPAPNTEYVVFVLVFFLCFFSTSGGFHDPLEVVVYISRVRVSVCAKRVRFLYSLVMYAPPPLVSLTSVVSIGGMRTSKVYCNSGRTPALTYIDM